MCQTSSSLQTSICSKTACTECAKQSMSIVDKPDRIPISGIFFNCLWYFRYDTIMSGSPIWRNLPHHVAKLRVPCSQASTAKQHAHSVPNRACLLLINRSESLFQVWYDHVGVTNMEEPTPWGPPWASWPVEAVRLLFKKLWEDLIFYEEVFFPCPPLPPELACPPPPRKMWII